MGAFFRGAFRRLAALCFAALLALGALWFVGTDGDYHLSLHKSWSAHQATGLSWEGVERATRALEKCLETGDTACLYYEDTVFGQMAPVFNQREIAHMEDVAGLFSLLKKALFMLAACALLFTLAGMKESTPRLWGKALLQGTGLFLFLGAALVLLCALDFSRAFTIFHHLFFDNDLWLLNPATDLMIRLLPESFFFAAAGRVALWAGLGLMAMLAAGAALTLWGGKKSK